MTPLDDTLDDLDGFAWIPGMAQILDGIRTAQQAAANGQLNLDATQTLLVLLGNPNGPDLQQALAELAQTITNPDTNTALRALDPHTVKTVQHLGELHVYETAEYAPRDHTNEACGLVYEAAQHAGGRCQTVTDDERKELSKKVADANKKSINRPR